MVIHAHRFVDCALGFTIRVPVFILYSLLIDQHHDRDIEILIVINKQ